MKKKFNKKEYQKKYMKKWYPKYYALHKKKIQEKRMARLRVRFGKDLSTV